MAEAKQGFWNCPCVPMRERKVSVQQTWFAGNALAVQLCITTSHTAATKSHIALPVQECHCMLFLTEDNDFRGEDQAITLDEVIESTKGMSGVQQT